MANQDLNSGVLAPWPPSCPFTTWELLFPFMRHPGLHTGPEEELLELLLLPKYPCPGDCVLAPLVLLSLYAWHGVWGEATLCLVLVPVALWSAWAGASPVLSVNQRSSSTAQALDPGNHCRLASAQVSKSQVAATSPARHREG